MLNYCIYLVTLCFFLIPTCAVGQDYQESLEAAIAQSNDSKVARLLKRRNKTSVKNFNQLIGWAGDVIEERRMLERTPGEAISFIFSNYIATAAVVGGMFYYFDISGFQATVREEFLFEENGFLALISVLGLLSAKGLYSAWSGPRNRLSKAYEILFSLEDTVDGIAKKTKAREQAVKRGKLRNQGVA